MTTKRSGALALGIILMVMSIIFIVGTAAVLLGTADLGLAFQQVQGERAQYAAEAGIMAGLHAISQNTSAVSLAPAGDFTDHALGPDNPDTYSVRLYTGGSTTPESTQVPNGYYYLRS